MFWTIVSLLFSCSIFGLAFYAEWRRERWGKQQKILQNRLFVCRGLSASTQPTWRVVLARPAYVRRFFRILPDEMVGLAIQEPDSLCLLARQPNGELFERHIPYKAQGWCWIGAGGWGSEPGLRWFTAGEGEDAWWISANADLGARVDKASADIFRQIAPDVAARQIGFAWTGLIPILVGIVVILMVIVAAVYDGVYDTHGVSLRDYKQALFGVECGALKWFSVALLGSVSLFLFGVLFGIGRSLSLSMVTATMFCSSQLVVPAALSIDRAFATEPERLVTYRLQKESRLEPLDSRLPKLNLGDSAYWAQFPEGSQYEFVFQRGALGLWQHKAAAYEQKKKIYFAAHPEQAAKQSEK